MTWPELVEAMKQIQQTDPTTPRVIYAEPDPQKIAIHPIKLKIFKFLAR